MIEKKYLLNNEFDLKLFLYITKKNLIFLFLFFAFIVISTFLFLRYTQPIYESFAIIQIKSDDIASRVFENQHTASYLDNSLNKKLEVLRSPMFMKRVVVKLPLDVQIFSVGKIGKFEQYNNASFSVAYQILDSMIFPRQVYITFSNNSIIIENINSGIKKEVRIAEPVTFPGIIFSIAPKNATSIENFFKDHQGEKYLIKFYLANELASIYANKVQIQVLNDVAKTIKISIRETNSKKAFDIVQQIVNEFEQYDLETQRQSTQSILTFIDNQLNKLDSSLTLLSEETFLIHDSTRDLNSIQINIETSKENILRLQREISNLNKLIQNLHAEDEVAMLTSVISGESFSMLSPYLNSLLSLEAKKRDELQKVTPESPSIVQINQQIDFQKKIISKIADQLKNNYANEISLLKSKINEWEKMLMMNKESEKPAYAKKQKLHAINQDIFNQLIQKKVEYSIALAGYVSQINVLQPPQIFVSPVKPLKKTVWFSAILFYVLFTLLYLGIRYLFYNKIVNPSDIKQLTDINVMGVIPKYFHYLPASQLIVEKNPNAVIAESFRSIRSQIESISTNQDPKIITITSTVSEEGKTFVALNLAGIFALGGHKTILIDFDLRKPKIHIGLNTENTVGLSSLLTGKASIEECIRASSIPNLHFITAGKPMLFPAEIVMSNKVEELLQHLKQTYDYILLDTPPVGLTSETLKLLLIADFSLYVVRANYTQKSFLLNVNKLKEIHSIKNLFIVVNSLNPAISSSAKYEGYVYGYAYGYGFSRHYYLDEIKPIPWYKKIFKKIINRKKHGN